MSEGLNIIKIEILIFLFIVIFVGLILYNSEELGITKSNLSLTLVFISSLFALFINVLLYFSEKKHPKRSIR